MYASVRSEVERRTRSAPPRSRRSTNASASTMPPAVPRSTAGSCHHSSKRSAGNGPPPTASSASSICAPTTAAAAPRLEEKEAVDNPPQPRPSRGAQHAGESPVSPSKLSRETAERESGGLTLPKLCMCSRRVVRSASTSEQAHAASIRLAAPPA
eukprot:scaffold179115_cov27-Tisochrysis_lutea.AAC.1